MKVELDEKERKEIFERVNFVKWTEKDLIKREIQKNIEINDDIFVSLDEKERKKIFERVVKFSGEDELKFKFGELDCKKFPAGKVEDLK